jgi:hypothetical protein
VEAGIDHDMRERELVDKIAFIILGLGYLGALRQWAVWRRRAHNEHARHMACHRNFEEILSRAGVQVMELDVENVRPTPSGVMWVNPEAVNGGSDD